MAKLQCPAGGGGCSVGGTEYTADKKGVVEVPDEFISTLVDHGYTLVVAEAKADSKKKADPADTKAE